MPKMFVADAKKKRTLRHLLQLQQIPEMCRQSEGNVSLQKEVLTAPLISIFAA